MVGEPEPGGKREARYADVFAIAHAEMAAMVTWGGPRVRSLVGKVLDVPAAALARSLVALDRDLARLPLAEAARARLAHYGVGVRVDPRHAAVPAEGPLVVVANHPGLFDALALFAAIGREDLAILAARRPLFEALPNLSRRLLLIDPGASASVALLAALRHLRRGGALLHFPAGAIEPDPRVAPPGRALLLPWKPGLDTLIAATARGRQDARAVAALVSGVISPRALALARIAARDGADPLTHPLVPLLQLTSPGFGDADVRVRFGEAASASGGASERLRGDLAAMSAAAFQAPR